MKVHECYEQLSWLIDECYFAIFCVEQIKSGGIYVKKLATGQGLKRLIISYLIVKMQCLFDHSKGSVSFERLANIMQSKMNNNVPINYKDAYSKIKSNHKDLLSRLEANRQKGHAHLQQDRELGFDEPTAKILLNSICVHLPVAKEKKNIFLTSGNFPYDEGKQLLGELRSLLMTVNI